MKAREAKLTYESAMKKAEADFAAAQADAAKAYSDRLQVVMKLALKADTPDLVEVNRLDAKIKDLATAGPTTQPSGYDYRWLMGVKWNLANDGGKTLTFRADHTIVTSFWNGTWAAVNANTIRVKTADRVIIFTFSATKMAVMDESNGWATSWIRGK